MKTQSEQALRQALAEQAATLPADASARLLAVDYRPRASRGRAVFPLAAIGAAACAGIALAVIGAGTEAPRAFAGWSPRPTSASGAQVRKAQAACLSQLHSIFRRRAREGSRRGADPAFRDFAPTRWKIVLTDTRGPYTMVVLEAGRGRAQASCFADRHAHVALGVAIGTRAPGAVARGRVALASSGSNTAPPDEGSRQFSQVVGRIGFGVRGVRIRLSDGTRVTATCANGWFLAWWPGSHGLRATEVTTASGTRTQ